MKADSIKSNSQRSLWESTTQWPSFTPLPESTTTDVLIIGGGLTGLLCAHMLKKVGIHCIVVEVDKICSGITKNTTAKITLGHGLIYDRLYRRSGEEAARLYLKAQLQACQTYEQLCQDIPCDYEKQDNFVYSLASRRKVESEVATLNRLGVPAEFYSWLPLPLPVMGAVCLRDQAQFHPLKFVYSLAKDLPIYEDTKVLELMPGKAITNRGEIRCNKMIVATHFPMLNKHGSYFLKLYQHRSYVLALEGAPNLKGMYVDEADDGLSFRSYGNTLLLGGGGHRTGKPGGGWQVLKDFAKVNFPRSRILGRWATQDCMSLDRIPYIGQYSKRTPDLFVATGFNKWGMSNSMVAAMILTDLVQGREHPCSAFFSPSRSILHPQLAVNAFESFVGLVTPTTPRCPHLGCALTYNKEEHSWDCPCHGSRFTESGELIDNPATDDKKKMPQR